MYNHAWMAEAERHECATASGRRSSNDPPKLGPSGVIVPGNAWAVRNAIHRNTAPQ